MNPPIVLEVDYDSALIAWAASLGALQYELQMQELPTGFPVNSGTANPLATAEGSDATSQEWTMLSSAIQGTTIRKKHIDSRNEYRSAYIHSCLANP